MFGPVVTALSQVIKHVSTDDISDQTNGNQWVRWLIPDIDTEEVQAESITAPVQPPTPKEQPPILLDSSSSDDEDFNANSAKTDRYKNEALVTRVCELERKSLSIVKQRMAEGLAAGG